MKRFYSLVLCGIICIAMISGCGFGVNTNSSEGEENSPIVNESSEVDTEVEEEQKIMTDGMVNETNAKTIEDTLKASYNFWEDHSLIQSSINKEWSSFSRNNEYDNYTKEYSLSAKETLEIEIASFATYDNDREYLLLCASFFNTSNINAEEVKQWISEYKAEDGYTTKVFGDAEFVMEAGADNDPKKLQLSVYALD